MRVGLLAHQTAHRLVGYADLPAHVLDALVDAFEFGAYLGEQDAGLALEIRVLGDVSHRLVDFAASLVGDDHLERVLETPAAVGFVERPVVFVMVGAERLLHADGARLHASAQIVAVVAFLERQFAQVDRHAAQRVVDADDVAHLLRGELVQRVAVLQFVDLLLPLLDVAFEQADAFAGVGGQLHARMLDLHDDAVGLRAGQRFRGVLEPVERLDRTVGARRETVQVAVRGDVERIGEPGVVAFAFLRQLLQDRVRGFRGRLPFLGRVIARFRKSGQTAGEPFLDDLAWQLAGERVERGAQQRDVQHGIAAQQQSQHPGLIHGPEPFHFPSYIRQRRPVLPLATSFPMRIHCKIACPFSRNRGGKTVRRERHLKMT